MPRGYSLLRRSYCTCAVEPGNATAEPTHCHCGSPRAPELKLCTRRSPHCERPCTAPGEQPPLARTGEGLCAEEGAKEHLKAEQSEGTRGPARSRAA